jgi:LPXTG-motif cell wall-anchored protein
MKPRLFHFALAFLLCQNVHPLSAQTLHIIDSIQAKPEKYDNEVVIVEGIASLYIKEGAKTTDQYIITDDYGDMIYVMTSAGLPETQKKYRVRGVVKYDLLNSSIVIIEDSRAVLPIVIINGGGNGHEKTKFQIWWESNNRWLMIGGLLVLLLILIYWYLKTRKESPSVSPAGSQPQGATAPFNIPPQAPPQSQPQSDATIPPSGGQYDFKTIRVSPDDGKTAIWVPGVLVISSGEDQGKELKMRAFPTLEGGIVTIGRRKITGEREYAHIQLLDQTVSREQAELIYSDHRLRVKNLSKTNFTSVNGVELMPGEMADLTHNSVLRIGALEMKYMK